MGGVGSGGSNRKSATQKKCEGTYRADRADRERKRVRTLPPSLGVMSQPPRCPPWATPAQRALFDHIVEVCDGRFSLRDSLWIYMTAVAVDNLDQLHRRIERDGGVVIKGADGIVRPHPLATSKKTALALVARALHGLGIDQLGRSEDLKS